MVFTAVCYTLTVFIGVWFLTCQVYENCRIRSAWQQHKRAKQALRAWQAARPFLKISQCEYSQSLVWVMIDAHIILLKYGESTTEYITYLKSLLTDLPKPYNPQSKTPPTAGFVNKC